MSSVNKALVLGHVGKDPDVHTFDNGKQKASFSIATSEKYKNKDGELVEDTQWHNIVCWGKTADIVEKYVRKGNQVFVEGTIKYSQYENKDGVMVNKTEINCFTITMLGSKNDNAGTSADDEEIIDTDDDLPC